MASPSLSSCNPTFPPPFVCFHSLLSSPFVLCRSMRRLSLPPLSSRPPFLCAPSLLPHPTPPLFFPIHPLFLPPWFRFPSAGAGGGGAVLLRSLLRELGELAFGAASPDITGPRRRAQTGTPAEPFSRSNFNCVFSATCLCLYLLQIPQLICARSLESISRTGLTSYVAKQRVLRDKPRRCYLNQLLSSPGRAKFRPTEVCLKFKPAPDIRHLPASKVSRASRRRRGSVSSKERPQWDKLR